MTYTVSKLWQSRCDDLDKAVDQCLAGALAAADCRQAITVFFRADDIAVPGRQFHQLARVFARHGVPLSMAVVPAWLTAPRWKRIQRFCGISDSQWCFYQHGWRHANHETGGKKQEFGPGRSRAGLEDDIVRGRDRLAALMGDVFFPAFTPPWNRCCSETLQILRERGFRVLSRSRGAVPAAPPGLTDFQINVDLHTRKERTANMAWRNLQFEMAVAFKEGFCGIMIHHQRMNTNALAFLDRLLGAMTAKSIFRFRHLKELSGVD